MKKSIYSFVFIFLLISSALLAQEGWYWQNPLPQGNSLSAVCFLNDNIGFASGSYGIFIRTYDGGNNWEKVETYNNSFLREIYFIDENNGYIVGDNGTILFTDDGGDNWAEQISDIDYSLYGLSFTDKYNGIAVGVYETILHTSNGGVTWEKQKYSANSNNIFYAADMIDNNTAVVVGRYGLVFRTSDAGNSWTQVNSSTSRSLSGVSFLNSQKGMAAGQSGTVLFTEDGGLTWTNSTIGSGYIYDICYTSEDNCLAVGENGKLIRFTSLGWTEFHNVSGDDFYGASRNTVVGKNGQIFRYYEPTETWDKQSSIFKNKLRDLVYLNENMIIAVGDHGTILRSTNAGESWRQYQYNSPTINGSINDYIRSVAFYDTQNGLAVTGNGFDDGSIPSFQDGLILKTLNGGITWNVVEDNNGSFNGVAYPSPNLMVAVGVSERFENDQYIDRPLWVRSSNGGSSWQGWYFSSMEDPLTDISFGSNTTGFAVGHNGLIMRTADAALNWSVKRVTNKVLNAVYCVNENLAFIAGHDGLILKTTNSGTNWLHRNSGINNDLFSIHFFDENYGIATGEYGTVLKTTDGGSTWEQQNARNEFHLYAGYAFDQLTMSIAGDNGTIMSTIDGGIDVKVEETFLELPQTFELKQNYPNPFNPNTTIEYTLPAGRQEFQTAGTEFRSKKSDLVKLSVYDILGREIAVLVNKHQAPGTYTVQWNAISLSSGIYFYRLNSGNYSQTKKMILIK